MKELTIAMTGLPNWLSFIPLALQRPLAPAIFGPTVHLLLLNSFIVSFYLDCHAALAMTFCAVLAMTFCAVLAMTFCAALAMTFCAVLAMTFCAALAMT